jgi:AcrR family transcriptional regulator
VPRETLTRDRVLRTAVAMADEHGIGAVTMRRLAEAVGIEAMSLYYHVAKKDDLLDGIVDSVAREINEAVDRLEPADDWRTGVRRRILTAREVFLKHRWAPHVFESRTTMSFEVVKYHDGLVGMMHAGGLSYDLIHHSLHALGSRAMGFAQEMFDPAGSADTQDTAADFDAMAQQVPNLVGMLAEVAHDDPDTTIGWCDDKTEFEFGLDLILDGLERLRVSAS